MGCVNGEKYLKLYKMSKTHYRKVFKSDHLGSADLEQMLEEGKSLVFTISHVKAEFETKVAGKKTNANIAYFKEKIKPLVLNAHNSEIVRNLAGGSPWVQEWKNIQVELYVQDNVKFGKQYVQGVRIKEQPPKVYTEKEIKLIKAKVAACLTTEELTNLYNSDIKIKTNKELVEVFRSKNRELNQK